MPTKYGKFSTSGNSPYTARSKPQPKAKPPKPSAGKVRDTSPVSQPRIQGGMAFRPIGSAKIKTYYGG